MSVKHSVVQLHRWSGLTIGSFSLLLALTGIILTARPHLERMVDPTTVNAQPCEAPISPEAIVAVAQAAHPGDVATIRLSTDGSQSSMVRLRDGQEVMVDRCRGTVLGIQPTYGGLFGSIEQLHKLEYEGWLKDRLAGTSIYKLVTGTTSLVLATLVVGGIYLWWPRRKSAWRASVKLNTALTGKAFARNLHNTTGLYVGLVVLFSALSGSMIVFQWPRAAIRGLTGTAPIAAPPQSTPVDGAPMVGLDSIWRSLLLIEPDLGSVQISLPKQASDPITTYFVARSAPHPEARNYAWFDAYSGKQLATRPYASVGPDMRLYYWSISLHTGRVGGLPLAFILLTGVIGVPVLAYTGLRTWWRKAAQANARAPRLAVRVAAVTDQATGIRSFELVSADRRKLPPFSPGAHIDVVVRDGLIRQYSLCNGPADTSYHIAVKREAASRGGSQALHETVETGARLMISPPRNHFPLIAGAQHQMLIAAGIGITPILSMARHLEAEDGNWTMHYFGRSLAETPFLPLLRRDGPLGSRISKHIGLDRIAQADTLERLLRERPAGSHLYVCGPRGFMDLVMQTARATWPEEALHVEHFGADPSASAGEQTAFEVELTRSGRTLVVPAGTTIAQALCEQKIDVALSCEQGFCGSCITEVIDGTPDHHDTCLTDAEKQSGCKMALCVSRAKTARLVLAI